MGDVDDRRNLVPRLCHIVRWPDFSGYGFNLHAEKGKAGQFIGKVDEGSPAEAAGLKQGDRIVEVNYVNIGNENHQQVVARIKAGGDETTLLVVDAETDQYYKDQKKVVRGDLDDVLRLSALRDIDDTPPERTTNTTSELNSESAAGTNEDAIADYSMPDESSKYQPRLCKLCKWADFDGYGFNLHAEKDKPGQYIGSIDPNSPAETGGLKENDRIIEVNGENIESQTHSVVIQKIKAGGDRTSLLVADQETDKYYKDQGRRISGSMSSVRVFITPERPSDVILDQQWSEDRETVENAVPREDIAEIEESIMVESSLPEATVSLEEPGTVPETAKEVEATEEQKKTERVADAVQQVESPPEPTENGTEEVGSSHDVAGHAMAGAHNRPTEAHNTVTAEGGPADLMVYEEVMVEGSAPPPTDVTDGTTSNGINGQAEVTNKVQTVVKESVSYPVMQNNEEFPAASRSQTTAAVGDLNLNVSAAEMKERLKARRKQDPRMVKQTFEQKHQMFEKL